MTRLKWVLHWNGSYDAWQMAFNIWQIHHNLRFLSISVAEISNLWISYDHIVPENVAIVELMSIKPTSHKNFIFKNFVYSNFTIRIIKVFKTDDPYREQASVMNF